MILLITMVILAGASTTDTQGDWTVVRAAVDLERTPLEIKQKRYQWSITVKQINVCFFDAQGDYAGKVWIYFSSPRQYELDWCNSRTNFPSTLPTAVDKVWRISLTRTANITLQIHCNNVEVLNLILSDETCNDYTEWRDYWTKDIEEIRFSSFDSASEYYRLYQQDDWKVVRPTLDLETTPLEIKTNSALGSGDRVHVDFYDSDENDAGGVWIVFSSIPQYRIYWCSSSYTNFSNTLPSAVDKVWRISLTRTSDITLQIHCNDVEVVNFLLSERLCDDQYLDWRSYWSKDVEKIGFDIYDTASDYYRPFIPGICTGLTPEWKDTIKTTTLFPVNPGTVVEVRCSMPGVINMGSSQVICAAGTQFTYRIEPDCLGPDDEREEQENDESSPMGMGYLPTAYVVIIVAVILTVVVIGSVCFLRRFKLVARGTGTDALQNLPLASST